MKEGERTIAFRLGMANENYHLQRYVSGIVRRECRQVQTRGFPMVHDVSGSEMSVPAGLQTFAQRYFFWALETSDSYR